MTETLVDLSRPHTCIEWVCGGAILVVKHLFEAWESVVALWAFCLETHPEFKTLYMAQVFTEWELLESISVFVVGEADEAPDNSMV